MENTLSDTSGLELLVLFRNPLKETIVSLETKARLYDETVKRVLRKSATDFDETFTRTYGKRYERHKIIFDDLFNMLNRFYSGASMNLEDEMNDFFTKLFTRMFEEMNPAHSYNSTYFKCLTNKMDILKVFGNVPLKIIAELKRSLIATRSLHQALLSARDVVNNVTQISPTPQCYKLVQQMRFCQHCQGLGELKPCRNLCVNVMSMCLRNFMYLDKEWNNFIEVSLHLIGRLETSFNIEKVVGPIDIRISEAIMNFQEKSQTVTGELFELCGKPRHKRYDSSNWDPSSLTDVTFDHSKRNSNSKTQDNGQSSLSVLLKELKRKLKRQKETWSKFVPEICNRLSTSTEESDTDRCWNNTMAGIGNTFYDRGPMYSKQQISFKQLSFKLKQISFKINSAYNGQESTINDDDQFFDEEGSGSGSGDDEGDDESPPEFIPSSPPDFVFGQPGPVFAPASNVSETIDNSTKGSKGSSTSLRYSSNILFIFLITSVLLASSDCLKHEW
ncbi:glypican-6-like isoform X2 [Brevipalpus obovatus]